MPTEERNKAQEEEFNCALGRILGTELPSMPEPTLPPIQVQEPDLGRWLNDG